MSLHSQLPAEGVVECRVARLPLLRRRQVGG
jgi:hypothetical protein